MTDTTAHSAHSAFRVLAALAELGEATAAAIADEAGLGYSTTTPKLRAWEDAGQAERFRAGDGRTLWRLTAAGRIVTAAPANVRHTGDDHAPAASPASADAVTGSDVAPAEAAGEPNGAGECDGTEPDEASADPPSRSSIGQPVVTSQPTSSGRSGVPAQPEPADAGEPADAVPPQRAGEDAASIPEEPALVPSVATAKDPDPRRDNADGAGTATTGAEVTADGGPAAEATNRRGAGTLRAAILDILEAHPDQRYKVSELCKLIDRANEGTDAKKASAGAVHNAATKLVQAGTAVLVMEKPATFALARTDD